MSKKMVKNSIRMRIGKDKDDRHYFKVLINHPMETGLRRDAKSRQLIPADYIQELVVSIDDEKYFEMTLGENVSRNPYIHFMFSKALFDNQKVQIRWVDNGKHETSYEFFPVFDDKGSFGFSGKPVQPESYVQAPDETPVCKTQSYTVTQ